MKNQSENETKKIENDKIYVMGRNVTRGWAGRGGAGGREELCWGHRPFYSKGIITLTLNRIANKKKQK